MCVCEMRTSNKKWAIQLKGEYIRIRRVRLKAQKRESRREKKSTKVQQDEAVHPLKDDVVLE